MPKTPPRKGRRRTVLDVKTPRRHRDSLDVFNLLAEDIGPQGPEGWFSIPWRDGRQAIRLTDDLLAGLHLDRTKLPVAARDIIEEALVLHEHEPEVYWICDDLRTEATASAMPPSAQVLVTMRLRMLQLLVSNSHGGGHGYNNILLHGWHKLDLDDVDVLALVTERRAWDAVGEAGVAERRRLAAFAEAWRAGLFRAAYALARVGK